MISTVTSDEFAVRFLGAHELSELGPLWEALYDSQKQMGMLLPIASDGFLKWERQMRSTLDRFSCVAVAGVNSEIVAFVAGKTRLLPGEFGGGPVGFISEVFVRESHRGLGLAKTLIQKVLDWFKQNGIKRVELQVIASNVDAKKLYAALGWREELTQMVFIIPD